MRYTRKLLRRWLTAISPPGHLAFTLTGSHFNREAYPRFLGKLLRSVKQKVFLMTDSHPVHPGKMVEAWLWANRTRIEVFYLPGYSAELNMLEYMNQDIKTNVAGKRRVRTSVLSRLQIRERSKTSRVFKTSEVFTAIRKTEVEETLVKRCFVQSLLPDCVC